MPGRAVSRWSRAGEDLLSARATLVLVLLLTLIQVAVAAFGGAEENVGFFNRFGLSRTGISEGRWWELVSHGFLHGNWTHLIINAFALLAFGPRLEGIGGAGLVLRVFMAGVVLGGIGHLLSSPGGAGETCLVGASGGATALLLWVTGVSPDSRMAPLPVSGRNLGLGMLWTSGVLTLLDPALGIPVLEAGGEGLSRVFGNSLFTVSHACHFGGALAGWMAARWALRPRVSLARLQKQRARRESAGEGRRGPVNRADRQA